MSNVPDHAKNAEDVYALDFCKNSSIFREYTRSSRFYGCKFKPENFDDFLSNDGFYEFFDLNNPNVYPLDVANALKDAGEVHVHINSYGGDVFAGLAISNMLKKS